jgi:hypothetical protein
LAVVYVYYAVVIQVFGSRIGNTVGIKVPAGHTRRSLRPGGALGPFGAVRSGRTLGAGRSLRTVRAVGTGNTSGTFRSLWSRHRVTRHGLGIRLLEEEGRGQATHQQVALIILQSQEVVVDAASQRHD